MGDLDNQGPTVFGCFVKGYIGHLYQICQYTNARYIIV